MIGLAQFNKKHILIAIAVIVLILLIGVWSSRDEELVTPEMIPYISAIFNPDSTTNGYVAGEATAVDGTWLYVEDATFEFSGGLYVYRLISTILPGETDLYVPTRLVLAVSASDGTGGISVFIDDNADGVVDEVTYNDTPIAPSDYELAQGQYVNALVMSRAYLEGQ